MWFIGDGIRLESTVEGKRSRWGGWPSKPERVARRLLVGSTPTLFRQLSSEAMQRLSPSVKALSPVWRKPIGSLSSDQFVRAQPIATGECHAISESDIARGTVYA